MEQVAVKTTSSSYNVYIGPVSLGAVKECAENPKKILLISDKTVYSLYGEQVKTLLGEIAPVECLVVESGEEAKSFEEYYRILTFALEKELDRSSMIAALGGGVVGDLAGFAAATFMRGIPFIQIPTTLLAHDSAVGGKTGINHPLGKNMIGAFHQPAGVFYDPQYLQTLSGGEIRSGMAEVIKHAMIADPLFLEWLQSDSKAVMAPDGQQLAYMIKKGIEIKAQIVSQDEKEKGIRAYLNFGHTLGHAIEAYMGYGRITHGDAVASGMLFAAWLSEKVLGADLNYTRLKEWFHSCSFPQPLVPEMKTEEFLPFMLKDKKAGAGKIIMVLLERIGAPVLYSFSREELQALLDRYRKEELN
ncbi:3-dehydroquinate synthase [Bacillus mangrovi]|uniref:3-dehydroquinate synthase n=1 Tax=Metabacillus mangrovi TaxID=1491830 RepID=A0A7X2S1V7_9BACI|nr:3-dehydroquinate synthase [Metabacillus mangrovi]MTH52174.1 3-dehydroquinate synthase [Metabacillus mangrovi]